MKKLIALLLLLGVSSACNSTKPNNPWFYSYHSEQLEDIAYAASNNVRLYKNFIARLDSGTVNIAEIRTFLFISQHAWSEHAQKIHEEVSTYEYKD